MATAPNSSSSAVSEKQEQQQSRNFKGVRLRKWGKWGAEIRVPNSRDKIWLGSFNSEEQAARAYDAALFCLRGPDSDFNFPGSPPSIVCVPESPSGIREVARVYAMRSETKAESSSSSVPEQEAEESKVHHNPVCESSASNPNWPWDEFVNDFQSQNPQQHSQEREQENIEELDTFKNLMWPSWNFDDDL